MAKLLIFGAGFSGCAIASEALAAGMQVSVVSRKQAALPAGCGLVAFTGAGAAIASATHIVSTAPPGEQGDPVLAAWGEAISHSAAVWLGYLSTTGVYGDRGGAWVDEATLPAPGQPRSQRRLAAEAEWVAAAGGRPIDLIRLAGIYGPGRSVLDDLRSGRARAVVKPGHAFGRIHVEDIARGVLAAMRRPPAGVRVLNFADDLPAESAQVLRFGAELLGMAPPAEIPFAEAVAGMSEMAQSFWSENRRVSCAQTKAWLGIAWKYPSFREGLAAILAAERA